MLEDGSASLALTPLLAPLVSCYLLVVGARWSPIRRSNAIGEKRKRRGEERRTYVRPCMAVTEMEGEVRS